MMLLCSILELFQQSVFLFLPQAQCWLISFHHWLYRSPLLLQFIPILHPHFSPLSNHYNTSKCFSLRCVLTKWALPSMHINFSISTVVTVLAFYSLITKLLRHIHVAVCAFTPLLLLAVPRGAPSPPHLSPFPQESCKGGLQLPQQLFYSYSMYVTSPIAKLWTAYKEPWFSSVKPPLTVDN